MWDTVLQHRLGFCSEPSKKSAGDNPCAGRVKGHSREEPLPAGRETAYRLHDRAGTGGPESDAARGFDGFGSIARVARQYGAEVVRRHASLSGDEAPSEPALLHVLDQLSANEAYEPDLVVFLQATSPLRSASDIEQAIATLERERADSLFSAGPSHGFLWRREPEGVVPLNYDPRHRPRRQEAPEDLVENGSIYVIKPWVLRDLGCRLGGAIAVFRMAAFDSLQLDELGDIPVMEFLLRTRHVETVGNCDER